MPLRRSLATQFSPKILVIEKTVPEAKRAEFLEWQQKAPKLFEQVVGHNRVIHFHRKANPEAGLRDLILVVYRTEEDRIAFEESEIYKEWKNSGKELQIQERTYVKLDDMGGWMQPTELASPPPKWKLACTIIMAIYPTQQFMSHMVIPVIFSQPWMPHMPMPVQVFASFVCVVPVMVTISMPLATKFMSMWFFPQYSVPRTTVNITLLGGIYSFLVYMDGVFTNVFPFPPTFPLL
jgi:antibiotic biosynthesis monooxygenase (ABM) superfamily enzyme